jgi:hypothetical protein
LRMAPQESASTSTKRVTSSAVMKQSVRHFNLNTGEAREYFAWSRLA